MSNSFARALALALLALLAWPQRSTAQACSDCIFVQGFENPFVAPANDADAARFLTQATFGPTLAEIGNLRTNGFDVWFDQQLSAPVSLSRPFLETYANTLAVGSSPNQGNRIDRWFQIAVTGPDQLRQRMAWALSQILVVSDRSDSLSGEIFMMAEYQDLLARGALGNYRTLLQQVSLSPMMGRYLSHLRNRKKEGSLEPDENYAREVMQLFSVGLVMRNRDYTPVDGDPGTPGVQTVPTYDQDIITNVARVLTGFSHQCNGGPITLGGVVVQRDCDGISGNNGTTQNPTSQACTLAVPGDCNYITTPFGATPATGDHGIPHPDLYRPMVCYPRYHDDGRTPVTNGVLLPLRPPLPPYDGEPYADKRIIGYDQNVIGQLGLPPSPLSCHLTTATSGTAPQRAACLSYCNDELGAALDELFEHPNTPSRVARLLIQRFVTSNPSPAYIDRVAAKFEDNGQGIRGDLAVVLRTLLLDPEARNTPTDPSYGKIREPLLRVTNIWRSFGAVSHDNRRWGLTSPETAYAQRPYGAPTVFNFYSPDYQQPGPVTDANLFSPEFEIVDENTLVLTANDLWTRITNRYAVDTGVFTVPGANDTQAYIPTTSLDALPADDGQLVEALNLRLMYGTMPGTFVPGSCNGGTGMKGVVHSMIRCQLGAPGVRTKALTAIHLIVLSPDYTVQR